MRKLLATAAATAVIAVASVAATTAPASAGFYFGVGGFGPHGYHHHHGYGYGGGVVVEVPVYEEYDASGVRYDRHVEWCGDHYKTYDEDTNLYFYKPGLQRECVSPFS